MKYIARAMRFTAIGAAGAALVVTLPSVAHADGNSAYRSRMPDQNNNWNKWLHQNGTSNNSAVDMRKGHASSACPAQYYWRWSQLDDGNFKLRTYYSFINGGDMVMDVTGASASNNSPVAIYTWVSTALNERWAYVTAHSNTEWRAFKPRHYLATDKALTAGYNAEATWGSQAYILAYNKENYNQNWARQDKVC